RKSLWLCGKKRRFAKAPYARRIYIGTSAFLFIWRDCVGIEPTEPGTQAPQGFEDPGGHQSPIQPQVIVGRPVPVYTEKKICARTELG
ncbi:hypothetical protein A1A1_11307, partial [Planococcus antarcticus DSM 14505]